MGCSQASAAAANAEGEGEIERLPSTSGGRAVAGSGAATPATSSGGNAVASMGPSDSFVRAACALQLQGLLRQYPFLEPQGCFQAHPLHLWVERCRDGYANNKFKAAQEDLRRLRSGLKAESRHLTEVFRRFDGDASGHLDASEFRHMCAYLAWGGEQADLIDLDGDGKVTLSDFQAFVGHLGGVQQLFERRRLRASASRQDVCNYAGIVVGSRVRAHFYVHRRKSKTWKEARVIAVNMEYRMAGPGAMSLGVLLEFRFGHGGKGGRGWVARQVVPMSWVLSSVEDASVAAALREVGILDEHQAFWALLLPDSEMQALATLERCQRYALSWVRTHSSESHTKALPKVLERFKKLGYTEQDLQTVLDWVQDLAPVIVHLNLDAMGKFMESDEFYRNQFETKTSFGCLDNNTRHEWEHDLFGGAYDKAKPFDRCKYGVLNVMNDYNGVVSARQYGDSYLVLKDVRLRLTFASTDSGGISGKRLAVLDHYAHVLQEYDDRELKSLVCVAKGAIAPDEERGGRSDGAAQLKLLRGKTEDPTKEWITVGFPGLVQKSGRFFFEVHLQVDCSAPQVGVLSPGFTRAIGTSTAQGVGDDDEGWAVDGLNSARWHSGNPKAWATWWPAKKDKSGDRVLSKDIVVGIAVDLDERKIFSATDGTWEEAPVFTADDIHRGTALYPALSVKGRAAFVFGPTFKHPPPDSAGAFAQWPGTFGGLVRVDCPHIGDSAGGFYKEIQIHGPLCLKEHVQRLVAAEKYREKPKAQRSFVLRVLNAGPCTGSYERAGARNGMPLYKSASNGVIYFHSKTGTWRISEMEDSESFVCFAPASGGPTSEPPRTGWEVPDEQHGVLPAAAVERALAAAGLGDEDISGMLQALKKSDETSGDLLVYRKLAGQSLAEECTRLGSKLGELESPDKLWEAAADEWRLMLLHEAGLERGQVLETGHPYEAKRTTWRREVSFQGASALTVHFASQCSTYDDQAAFKIYAGGLLRNNAGAGARVEIKGLDGGSNVVCGTVVERKPAGVGPWVVQLDRHERVEDPSAGSSFRPAVGDVVEALHKSGGWHKAKVTEVIAAMDWYDAVWEPKTIIVKWMAGGFSDDCEKSLAQIRRPQVVQPSSRVIEAMPRYGKVPREGERCLATCLEKPSPVKVTYKGGAKVGDEITGFALDRTCPLAPISIAGFSGQGPAQASGVEVGWYLDLVATSTQGSSKEKLQGLLDGIGGIPPAGGTSAKAKNIHLNRLLDASFADLEELLRRLNEGLRDMTDVTLAFTKSCSSQTVTLLPEAFAVYTGGQKVGDEVKEFSTAGAVVGPAAFVVPGPAQEAGVREDWVLDVARTIKESGKLGKEAADGPSAAGGPLPELVRGVWASEKGGCRILHDASSGKLSYEEELPQGAGLLHGDLVWQGPQQECWEAVLQLRKPPATEGEGAEPTDNAEPEAKVGKIRATASRAAPLSLETRIHVDGEDVDWHPPVAWQRDLAKDPNSLLPFSGVTLVFRQPRPSKSEVFKGSGARQDGQRWTCRELPGSSADFEFSTDGDGADHPESRWGAWALVLPREVPPPDSAALDALADRWAESLAKASGTKETIQVERDGWDEQRLRALCARHGWEFEWMTEDGERRRQVDERQRLGGGRVDLAGVRKVALERQRQTAAEIAKESSAEAETGAPPNEQAQDRPRLQMKRSASGFNLQK